LFIGLFANKKVAAVFGFLIGIYLDILTSKQVGISCIIFALIGYLGGFLDKTFSKESKITIILMVLGCTYVYETILYIYTTISNKAVFDILGFNKILFIEVVFNGLMTIILYPIIRNCGDVLERIFKSQKTVTLFLN
jgi:rod shape-determining protein MreD